jgi:hypothetical protein
VKIIRHKPSKKPAQAGFFVQNSLVAGGFSAIILIVVMTEWQYFDRVQTFRTNQTGEEHAGV